MKTEYPLWVKLGIWGCGSRQTIQIFIWLSIGLALAILLNIGWRLVFLKEGIDGGSFVTFCIFTLAFLHYYCSRRWVDKNGNWEEVKSNWASGFQMVVGAFMIQFRILVFVILSWLLPCAGFAQNSIFRLMDTTGLSIYEIEDLGEACFIDAFHTRRIRTENIFSS